MLTETHVTVMVPVVDINRAENFYKNNLGFKKKKTDPSGNVLLSAGDVEIGLYKGSKPPSSDHTVMTFEVNDVKKEIKELEGKGVKFENYTDPDFKTDADHICRKNGEEAAWFKDSEGNILCVHRYGH